MTKRRSSISGRGAEILLGEPPPVQIVPRGPDEALAEAQPPGPAPVAKPPAEPGGEPLSPPAGPGPLLGEADLEALFEEARAGEPAPEEEEEGVPLLHTEPPSTPEMQSAPGEETKGAEVPSATVAEAAPSTVAAAPARMLEATTEEKDLPEEAAVYEPSPPETSVVASDLLPPRPVRFDMGAVQPTDYDIQEPAKRVEPFELPDRELTEEERQKILAWLGSARLQELDGEIGSVYEEVRSQVGENDEIATDCHNKLLKARDIIVRQDAAKIPQAEYYVEQVRARLKGAADSEAGAKKYAWLLAVWGLLWFAIYTTVLILFNFSWFRGMLMPVATGNSPVDMEVFVPAMIWGGIGGVACVFYSLFKHVGQRDFDTHYNLSYVGKPFLGVILGATVYMIVQLLILILGIMPAGLRGTEGINTTTVAPWIIYLLAWACGFKENRIFDLVDRVMKRIFSGGEAAQPAPPVGPGEPTA